MKVSHRLQFISQLVTTEYDHIWDCCCDHGLLGMLLLERRAAAHLHFVDLASPIMCLLEVRLNRYFPQQHIEPHCRWYLHCGDVANLPLADFDMASRHLVIIAGVGGELLVKLVEQILLAHPQRQLDFILCPIHHNYWVRTKLKTLGLGLISEHLISENRRFYEVLYVSKRTKVPISPIGDGMWDWRQDMHHTYLGTQVTHYQRLVNGGVEFACHALEHYQVLFEKKIKNRDPQ